MVQSDNRKPVTSSVSVTSTLAAATLVVSLCWIFIVILSRRPDHLAAIYFLLAAAVMLIVTGSVVWKFQRLTQPIPIIWIMLSAALLRLVSLYGQPLFEDDYYRYLWDGLQTATNHDPYSLPPAAFFSRDDYPEVFDEVLSLINYPDIATVYGPVAQWIFALGYLLQPAAVWPLQLMSGLADLLVLLLLYKLGAGRALLFYAWSPLLLKEFSLTAHPDVFAILAVVLSMYLLSRSRYWVGGIALALGAGAKVFAIIALPFLISLRWSVPYWIRLCGGVAMTLALITLSFGSLSIWAPEGLLAMADSWLFNSAVYLSLLTVLDFPSIKLLLLVVFAVLVGFLSLCGLLKARVQTLEAQERSSGYLPKISPVDFRGDWLFALFLISLPVVNAWYVAWLLPFATLHPRWWSWAASYFCLFSYCTGVNFGMFGEHSLELPVWIVAVEYSAILGVLLVETVLRLYRQSAQR